MAPIRRFEDIEGWQAARKLHSSLAKAIEAGAFNRPSLADQMERSARSSMANIVEGYDAGSDREFIRFLKIAKRSASEFQSHLYAALDIRQCTQKQFDLLYDQAGETKRLIGGFIRYLESALPSKARHVAPRAPGPS